MLLQERLSLWFSLFTGLPFMYWVILLIICFQTNAPEVSYNLLSFQRLQKLIKLHFIVGENEIDELMERSQGSGHLQGRSFVVMQWLRILGKINKLYTSLQMKLPALHMIEAILNRTNNAFIDEAIVSVHQEDLHREETIGDDVADVRTRDSRTCRHETQSEYFSEGFTSSFASIPTAKKHCTSNILNLTSNAIGFQRRKRICSKGQDFDQRIREKRFRSCRKFSPSLHVWQGIRTSFPFK